MHSLRITRLFVVLAACCLIGSAAHADTVLITGANSGIGLEFATQYAGDGWTVIATHRRATTPETLSQLAVRYKNVRIEKLDVTNVETIQAVADNLAGMPIDLLINNAGLVGDYNDPAHRFGTLDYDLLHQYMDINAAGPLRVSEALYANVRASKQGKIVAISSAAGSLAMVRNGLSNDLKILQRYGYNMSKAALNIAFTQLATVVADDGVAVATYHPGLVKVARNVDYDIPEQLQPQMLEVSDSVRALRQRFAELDLDSSGRFISYNGIEMP